MEEGGREGGRRPREELIKIRPQHLSGQRVKEGEKTTQEEGERTCGDGS